MPFKSKKQAVNIAILEHEGEVPKGTYQKWKRHTPNMKKLPKQAPKKKK